MTADVAEGNHDGETEEERRIRLHEEEMERLLMDQEVSGHDDGHGEDPLQHPQQQALNNEGNNNNNNNFDAVNDGNNNGLAAIALPEAGGGFHLNNNNAQQQQQQQGLGGGIRQKLSYTHTSFLAAFITILYALRTRGQWYLALVYLSSSKWAYCVLGNALVALAVQIFTYTTSFFLQGGLRLHEAEGLQDFFRWNVTETCLALTMFRSELTIGTACEFLCLILAKCLHHVTVLRQDHLRMTDDAIQPASWNAHIPTIPWHHLRVLSFLLLLQFLDLCALQYMIQVLDEEGPSVSILFAFEAAILLASAWSHLLLWHLHVLDGLLHFAHDLGSRWGRRWLHTWKEHKATLTFAVELQAQAVQFLFNLSYFCFVLTYYGVPINLFREVYISFAALKERMLAFYKYRRLMAGMSRFANPSNDEELDEAGRVCIICRDEMTLHDCKKLPVCQHIFHKSCLREWLTQQQSCPTCRSDIVAMQAQEATRNAAGAAAAQRQEEEPAAAGADAATAAPAEGPGPTDTEHRTETTATSTTTVSTTNTVTDSNPLDPSQSSKQQVGSNGERATENGKTSTSSVTVTTKTKAVRFSETTQSLSVPNKKQRKKKKFPALYRVVKGEGASLWHFDDDDNNNNGTTTNTPNGGKKAFVVRTIPLSVAVLGETEELKYLPPTDDDGDDDDNNHGHNGHIHRGTYLWFVKIPDGWIWEDDILRVYTLPG